MKLKKKDIVYYTKILPSVGIYEISELKVRTVEDDYFVGIDKHDKHAYLLNYSAFGKTVFEDRKVALKIVQEAEKKKTKVISNESYYEEY
jgi:hypothetical protein